jgi:GH15 family glucan-1,4-alpha-glucosidase
MQIGFVAYPPIAQHGVIGDRRTAALVAADGTISWWCLPNYDGTPVFGAVIDAERGGWWRIGPEPPMLGKQRYVERTAILTTVWDNGMELVDAMPWPEDDRPPADESRRVIVRRVRARRDAVSCAMTLAPQLDFDTRPVITAETDGLRFDFPDLVLGLWASVPAFAAGDTARAEFTLVPGEDAWFVLGLAENARAWSTDRARAVLQATGDYWREWDHKIAYTGPRREQVRRSAQTIHLLSFAPSGAMVAAPTASLPERIGGNRNYDYRFAWVRDASLSMAILAMLGNVDAAARYMDWLAGLGTSTEMPLQVLYRIDSGTDTTQRARDELSGYRQSRPVLFGNHAFAQVQGDSLGYLADCSLIYLEHGGR